MDEKITILAVDDTPDNLTVLKQILGKLYKLLFANNGDGAIRQLRKGIQKRKLPDLILLDIMMPGKDGYAVCQEIMEDETLQNIPVMFVSAKKEAIDEARGFELGAVDYITKPFDPLVIKTRISRQLDASSNKNRLERLVRRRTDELARSQRDAISMLGECGHYNDTDTGVHIWRMAAYSEALARSIGWNTHEVTLLGLAAPMHDMGKIGIPDWILSKPGKLDADEWKQMESHTIIGKNILSKGGTPLFQMATEVAFSHHEKWNGEGYPQRLSGDVIPLSARIVAIADVFDALTMRRPYKDPWSIEKTVAVMTKDAGTHFDPELIPCFREVLFEILEIKSRFDAQGQGE